MFNASRVSLASAKLLSVDEVSCDFEIQNRITLSRYLKWDRGFVDARGRKLRTISARNRRAHPARVVAFGGFILARGRWTSRW